MKKYFGLSCSRYINSPGGSVTAGLAIYDTMQSVSLIHSITHLPNMIHVNKGKT